MELFSFFYAANYMMHWHQQMAGICCQKAAAQKLAHAPVSKLLFYK